MLVLKDTEPRKLGLPKDCPLVFPHSQSHSRRCKKLLGLTKLQMRIKKVKMTRYYAVYIMLIM